MKDIISNLIWVIGFFLVGWFTDCDGAYILSLFWFQWLLSITAHSLLLHQYATHGAFYLFPKYERRAYWIVFFCMNAHYLSPYTYAVMHRMHHLFADTKNDTHPVIKGLLGLFKTMHATRKVFSAIDHRETTYTNALGVTVPVQYIPDEQLNLPRHDDLDRLFSARWVRLVWSFFWFVIYGTIISGHGLTWWWLLLLPLQLFIGPFHGAIINWGAHLFGERHYNQSNHSTNLPGWFRLLMLVTGLPLLGEELHHNHHYKPTNYDFSLGDYHTGAAFIVRILLRNNMAHL